jgi:hypothetical protein
MMVGIWCRMALDRLYVLLERTNSMKVNTFPIDTTTTPLMYMPCEVAHYL